MGLDPSIPDLDQRTVQSIMKLGGKKKFDSLIDMFQGSSPVRMQDLKEARTLADAKAAAKALKSIAGSLGLAHLEDLCDQIMESKAWAPGGGALKQAELALDRGRKALLAYRAGI